MINPKNQVAFQNTCFITNEFGYKWLIMCVLASRHVDIMISILSIVHRQIELKQNSRGMPVHDR